jgi:2-polyprenyl-3-methyl-5-hydroxy-6-metoxy-1,4-benzoquinol methylase
MSDVLASLRTRFDVVLREVAVGGRNWQMARPKSADELIDEDAFQRDGRIPYWADVWLSSAVLADELARRGPVAARAAESPGPPAKAPAPRLLELGCGVGFSSIVAAGLGYDVLATDYYAEALEFVSANALLNDFPGLATALLDWREPPASLGRFEVVTAADVLYERPNVPLVAGLFDRFLTDEGIGLCTDPQRGAARSFADECRKLGLHVNCFIRAAEENGRSREIDLYVIGR